MSLDQSELDLVWYASYGSNMHADRLRCYLEGGTPPGGRRACPGCRDPRPPRRTAGHRVAGGVYFATESLAWGGGRAFLDPELEGSAALRAYLVTPGQFADVVAQEMYREPGTDLDLREVRRTGRDVLGPGRYETLLHVGDLDGHPVLTFTASWSSADVPLVAPSAAYLRMLLGGLRAGQGWDLGTAARYLAALPGARGRWGAAEISALAT
ncbi:histone deacetylase [Saccharopolyspora sp. NFXS83]|uniref:histone deacetylase n=1 Tax=Saccharopolyspora sp. NFXS83 TaxID=2993560 RepID=UPI00224A7541|nr:histone deacetylase [Saccharopolyspora sp. NFXS83]MCX2734274.1 histone deacetylase [Saccharopolyspora sp. NFXS83]